LGTVDLTAVDVRVYHASQRASIRALKGVDLEINPPEFCAIIAVVLQEIHDPELFRFDVFCNHRFPLFQDRFVVEKGGVNKTARRAERVTVDGISVARMYLVMGNDLFALYCFEGGDLGIIIAQVEIMQA